MNFEGKKVLIVGIGRSGVAVAELLLSRGARIYATDIENNETTTIYAEQLYEIGVAYEIGCHSDDIFDLQDCIVVSPGVPLTIPALVRAQSRRIPILGELEVAFQCCRAKVLAVTGTNGKTTTTELLRAMIAACGHKVPLAGNNDRPLSRVAIEGSQPEYVVVEVSSYQLETTQLFRPWIAALLNATPDHLKRHGTMDAYIAAKFKIFANQRPGDIAVLNADDAEVADLSLPTGVRKTQFSVTHTVEDGLWTDGNIIRAGTEAVATCDDVPLPGRHNIENALAALTMARAANFDWEKCLEGLRNFKGVAHRIEHVLNAQGVDYYNDSKSTNVDSLRVALQSFDRPLVLIAGGRGKGDDYETLIPLIEAHVKALITFGEDAENLQRAFADIVQTECAPTFEEAINRATQAASPGDIVLLSPGCASFDTHKKFEDRGNHFKRHIKHLAAQQMKVEKC